MSYCGGATGIAAGSSYAVARSAAMGGAQVGIIATVGALTIAGVAAVVVPPVAFGAYFCRGQLGI